MRVVQQVVVAEWEMQRRFEGVEGGQKTVRLGVRALGR